MRQIIIFFVIAIVLSLLRRGRGAGTGAPVARPPGLDRIPPVFRGGAGDATPPTARPMTKPVTKLATKPDPAREARLAREARVVRARTEQRLGDKRRQVEAEAASAEATAPGGARTAIPGGIDPRLLDRDRTLTPTTSVPLHPR